MRLLLIEDDESLCLSLSYQLRQDGFAPETCHDGEEGLLWARQHHLSKKRKSSCQVISAEAVDIVCHVQQELRLTIAHVCHL